MGQQLSLHKSRMKCKGNEGYDRREEALNNDRLKLQSIPSATALSPEESYYEHETVTNPDIAGTLATLNRENEREKRYKLAANKDRKR